MLESRFIHKDHPLRHFDRTCSGCIREAQEAKVYSPPGGHHDGSMQTTEKEAWLNRIKEKREHTDKDPSGKDLKEPGTKGDSGKSPLLRGVLQYFPRALRAISQVSSIGASKYSWKGWEQVPDGINRYGDALLRHLIAEELDGLYDKETGCLHAAQVAWNSLARLELILRDQECLLGCYSQSQPSTVPLESTRCGTAGTGGGGCSGSATQQQISRG